MKVLFEVTSNGATEVFVSLARACGRTSMSWGCFFTGDGIECLSSEEVIEVVLTAVSAKVCEVSWENHMGEHPCPIELGSQTINSSLVGNAEKVISL